MDPTRIVIDDPRQFKDPRTFVERFWDESVNNSRKRDWPYMSDLMWGAHQRRGAAHELDPSARWMRWGNVRDRVLELMMTPRVKATP